LVDAEREGRHAAVPPIDAATLIVVDRSSGIPEVLLGRRHVRHVFMPDKFVFPGGRVDPADRLMGAGARLDEVMERRLFSQTDFTTRSDVAALPLAAVRETFEETGLVVGEPASQETVAPEEVWAQFFQTGFFPAVNALHFIARAITPPGFPRRFDARFFSVDRSDISYHAEGVVNGDAELVELVCLPIEKAMSLEMPLITGLVLEELQERIAAGFDRHLPVPFYATRDGEFCRDLLL
jgi:8-oxo-dGTP pyrophosphatase MutT (NUDIX family)